MSTDRPKNSSPFGNAPAFPMPPDMGSSGEERKAPRSNDTTGYSGGAYANRALLTEVVDEARHKSMVALGLEKEYEAPQPTEQEILMEQLIAKFGVDGVKNMLSGEAKPEPIQYESTAPQEEYKQPESQQIFYSPIAPIKSEPTVDINSEDYLIKMITEELLQEKN